MTTASVTDGVLHIELDRPQQRNALDLAAAESLVDAVRAAAAPGVRAVLLTAAGETFCVGGDIAYFLAAGTDIAAAANALASALHRAVLGLYDLGVPVVAAIQGWCAGAGIGLACGADVVVAGAGARFRSAYTGIGFSPDLGMTWLLPRLIGGPRAADMIFTNRTIDAETAERWGLVARVVPDEQLIASATEIAVALASGPTPTHRVVRGLLRDPDRDGLRAALDAELMAVTERAASPEGVEGIRAFTERRPPLF
jgi:2-(1,2-epoxy-1,2-dihydrophenyl)acetyl-CoA isomerase